MAKAVVGYDKELPEIADRLPWERPTSHLVKDKGAPGEWREVEGRRESHLLLVPKIRAAVDAWRTGDPTRGREPYAGASHVAKRLLEYWFEEDHEVADYPVPFRYHFCQREAIETLIWLVEVVGQRDGKKLVQSYATVFRADLFGNNVEFQTRMENGKAVRVVKRYMPELEKLSEQDLPVEDLRRFAFKMATGSGKTWVMAMTIVWSYLHRKLVAGSDLSTNFLIVPPNVIVYQRLEKDFGANRIFNQLPLVPPEWRPLGLKVILRGEAAEPDPSGNLFLSNIQQLYASRDREWTPENAVEALLGRRPPQDPAAANQRSMLERLKSLKDLVVLNDEAHHVHDEDLEWHKSLMAVHQALPKGLSAWLDFSATPRLANNGPYFAWTVCDYPLAQAVEDRIVKAPLIVTGEDDPELPKEDPAGVTADNVADKYGYWLRAAVARWKEHHKAYKPLGLRPVLFIMAEKSAYADALGEYLWKTKDFEFRESEILVIHTDTTGEITKKDLEKAREAARDIDLLGNKIKVIVSVLMLKEGWDVRGVTVALGLRAYGSEILAEQVIGRGLRRMHGVGPDRTQTLEVLGTRNLLQVLREQLEADGVATTTTANGPVAPVNIYPEKSRLEWDIAIPLTKPSLGHEVRRLADLDVSKLEAIYEQVDLEKQVRETLKLEFAHTQTEVHTADVPREEQPSEWILASITEMAVARAKLTNCFAMLYPLVREYVETRCFGRRIDIEAPNIRSRLSGQDLREGIAKYLARKIGELTLERRSIEFDQENFVLSQTKPFSWRRNLKAGPLTLKKTVFNYVATYNDFERRFAAFLSSADDVLRFASLGTTEQGESGTAFRVDYLKPSGAIGFYHPDWVAVQKMTGSEVNWIIETKGRVWESTAAKDTAMNDWCERVSAATRRAWRYRRVNQGPFDASKAKTFAALLSAD